MARNPEDFTVGGFKEEHSHDEPLFAGDCWRADVMSFFVRRLRDSSNGLSRAQGWASNKGMTNNNMQEIASEALARVWAKLLDDAIDGVCPEQSDDVNTRILAGYFWTTCRRLVKDAAKKKRPADAFQKLHQRKNDIASENRNREMVQSDWRESLSDATVQALESLSEDHRILLVLTSIYGMQYDEAADALGLPIGTVMSRLYRAKKAAAKAFGPEEKEDLLRFMKKD